MRTLLWVGVVGSLCGCGGTDDEPELNLTRGCDIRQAACQEAIFRSTVEVRGQNGATMPEVRTATLDEFVDYLNSLGGQEMGAAVWDAVLPLLRLLPEDSSISEEVTATAAAQVAAYYDDESKRVTVIDRGETEPLDDLFVLAHEFVHSLQDEAVGLVAFRQQWVTSLDSQLGVTSLIEGEAVVLGYGVLAKALHRTPRSLNWAAANASIRQAIFDDAASSRAPLFAATQGLPYMLGTAQLAPLWLDGGQPAIDRLYAAPPLSALDWAEDTSVTAGSRLQELDCLPTAGPPGFSGHSYDSFGPVGVLSVLLDAGIGIEDAWRRALAVRGDLAVVFEEEGVAGSRAVAWRTRFVSAAQAQSFRDAVFARLPAGSGLLVQDREVVYYGATLPEKRASWSDPGHCGTVDELPAQKSEAPASDAIRRWRTTGWAQPKQSWR